MLRVPPTKEYYLMGPRRRAMSAVAPALWNIIFHKVRLVVTLLAFQKGLKTWVCHHLLGSSDGMESAE